MTKIKDYAVKYMAFYERYEAFFDGGLLVLLTLNLVF